MLWESNSGRVSIELHHKLTLHPIRLLGFLGRFLPKDEALGDEVSDHLPDDLSHVHSGNHLLEDLLARIDGAFVNAAIPPSRQN